MNSGSCRTVDHALIVQAATNGCDVLFTLTKRFATGVNGVVAEHKIMRAGGFQGFGPPGDVVDQADIDRLVATNRDYMWDQHIEAAHFKRIDGGAADDRWKDSP